jgi:hypothetical protein
MTIRIHIVSYLTELFRMIYTGGNELWNFCSTSKKQLKRVGSFNYCYEMVISHEGHAVVSKPVLICLATFRGYWVFSTIKNAHTGRFKIFFLILLATKDLKLFVL